MDIEALLAYVKMTYGIEAYSFKREEGIVGITIEGPEQTIKEKLIPDLTDLVKGKVLNGIFK